MHPDELSPADLERQIAIVKALAEEYAAAIAENPVDYSGLDEFEYHGGSAGDSPAGQELLRRQNEAVAAYRRRHGVMNPIDVIERVEAVKGTVRERPRLRRYGPNTRRASRGRRVRTASRARSPGREPGGDDPPPRRLTSPHHLRGGAA